MNPNQRAALLGAGKEAEAARLFGSHVSKEKAYVLLLVTTLTCALPIAAGLRLWESIPELVETGIIRFDGTDDSIPRRLLVFGIPGLLVVLNLISHIQLYRNQLRMTLPKIFIRLLGRWGASILSVGISSAAVFSAAKLLVPYAYTASCFAGLALLVLGSHMLDCPQNAAISLRISFIERNSRVWLRTHRFAAYLWMVAGLALLAFAVCTFEITPLAIAAVPVVFALPIVYGRIVRE